VSRLDGLRRSWRDESVDACRNDKQHHGRNYNAFQTNIGAHFSAKSYFIAETGSRRTHTILTRSSSSNSFPTEASAKYAWLCIKQVTGFANSVGTRIAALAFAGLQSARFGVNEAVQIRTKAVSMRASQDSGKARMHNAYQSRLVGNKRQGVRRRRSRIAFSSRRELQARLFLSTLRVISCT
jgi:hypothetical protein